MPSSRLSIVIVGAGIIGAAIAHALAARGAAVTVLADRAEGEATGASFAWINASHGNREAYVRLRLRAMAEWAALAAALPTLPFRACGGLIHDLPPAELDAYAAEHGRWGYRLEALNGEAVASLEPFLAAPPDRALLAPDEGFAEPLEAAAMLLAAAAAYGAVVHRDVTVTGLSTRATIVTGVTTAGGRVIDADAVVLAAGLGSVALAQEAGIALPLAAPPGLLVHSRPAGRLLNGLVLGPGLHMRQTLSGRLVAGSDFAGGDPGDDPAEFARALFARLQKALRGGADLELERYTLGRRPVPADGEPVIGLAPGLSGLYLAVTHSGVTLAPALGAFAAAELLDGAEEPLLAPFRLARFA